MKNEVKARNDFIEKQLRDYKANKGLVTAYITQGSPSPVLSNPNAIRATQTTCNSSTERQALKTVELSEQLAKAAWYVSAIDDLLNIVAEEEKTLLEMRYFLPRPWTCWQVANHLHISRTEFYRRRDVILNWLDKRMGNPVWVEVRECG